LSKTFKILEKYWLEPSGELIKLNGRRIETCPHQYIYIYKEEEGGGGTKM
jgi:hypothetical protein